MTKQKKLLEDFAAKFKSMTMEERLVIMQKLPRGKVLDFYAQKGSLEQLRELKADFMVRGLDEDWRQLLQKLHKRRSPHYSLLVT
jgi:hypothetical protein